MFANPAWTVDVTRVLTRRELASVLADAKAQADRSLNAQRNLIIVRLACCCGMRVSEIGALRPKLVTDPVGSQCLSKPALVPAYITEIAVSLSKFGV